MKNFLKRQWPLLGLGLLLVTIALYLVRSGRELIQAPLLKDVMSGEGIKLKDIQYAQNDPNKGLKWVLDASEVRFSEDKNTVFFNDFHLRLEPENRPFFELKGNRGDYSRDSGNINLWGDLDGVSGNGYRIVTEHLMINEKRRQVNTEKPVRISGPFFTVAGRGLFVDLEQERIKVLSDVTTVLDREPLI